MNAQELFIKADEGFKNSGRYYCEKCGSIHWNKQLADACCSPPLKRYCPDCGKEERYGCRCSECHSKAERERLLNMPIVEDIGQPVVIGYDRYFSSSDELQDSLFEDEYLKLDTVETCDVVSIKEKVSAGDVLNYIEEQINENLEDSDFELENRHEFAKTLDGFLSAQTFKLWEANGKRILLKKPDKNTAKRNCSTCDEECAGRCEP